MGAPDFCPADLSADGLGELLHKFDQAGIFIGRGYPLHMVLQFLLKRFIGRIADVYKRQELYFVP